MADDPLLAPMAEALTLLFNFVDARSDQATVDDDVKALEDAAAALLTVAGRDRERLAGLLGPKVSSAIGLV
jgi:hypothetical protein